MRASECSAISEETLETLFDGKLELQNLQWYFGFSLSLAIDSRNMSLNPMGPKLSWGLATLLGEPTAGLATITTRRGTLTRCRALG